MSREPSERGRPVLPALRVHALTGPSRGRGHKLSLCRALQRPLPRLRWTGRPRCPPGCRPARRGRRSSSAGSRRPPRRCRPPATRQGPVGWRLAGWGGRKEKKKRKRLTFGIRLPTVMLQVRPLFRVLSGGPRGPSVHPSQLRVRDTRDASPLGDSSTQRS